MGKSQIIFQFRMKIKISILVVTISVLFSADTLRYSARFLGIKLAEIEQINIPKNAETQFHVHSTLKWLWDLENFYSIRIDSLKRPLKYQKIIYQPNIVDSLVEKFDWKNGKIFTRNDTVAIRKNMQTMISLLSFCATLDSSISVPFWAEKKWITAHIKHSEKMFRGESVDYFSIHFEHNPYIPRTEETDMLTEYFVKPKARVEIWREKGMKTLFLKIKYSVALTTLILTLDE